MYEEKGIPANLAGDNTPGQRTLTMGEQMVGINFNPGGDERVNKVKKLYAKIIDLCREVQVNSDAMTDGKHRCLDIAIMEAQTAQNVEKGTCKHVKQDKPKWEEEFEEKYCNFEISERISKPDMLNIKSFIQSLLNSEREEAYKEGQLNCNGEWEKSYEKGFNLARHSLLQEIKEKVDKYFGNDRTALLFTPEDIIENFISYLDSLTPVS